MKSQIQVGVIHSLSGTMSFSESALVDATLMAFDDINAAGGVLGAQVKPLVEDCRSDAEVYALKTKRLIKRNRLKHFFGCWTSASRKAVKPVVEAHDALLWYPVQYEGLEQSPNIVYTGNCLNQQIEPAVNWAARHLGRTCYLVGSDYVFPRTANKLIHTLCRQHGIAVVGERYLPLGSENFERIVDDIIQKKPAVVFNTINGDSNLAFYYYLGRAGNTPEQSPVMAFSIGEVELRDIGLSVIGHYACCGYFQCLDTDENREFIRRFRDRYGGDRVVSDPVVSAYVQPFLWKQLVEKGGSFEVPSLKSQIAGITHEGPSGHIEIHANHHAVRPALIGRVNRQLQFDIVWQHPEWIEPLPWLGLEHQDITAKQLVQEAMAAYPETIDFSAKLQQEVSRRKFAEAELKQRKSELRESRAAYRALFNALPLGVLLVDPDNGCIKDCNHWIENLFGTSRAVLKKKYIWELGPPDQWDAARERFFSHKAYGTGDRTEVTVLKPNGQTARLNCQSGVIETGGKSLTQLIITEVN